MKTNLPLWAMAFYLLKKQWECLSRRGGKLQLLIKGDGLEVHDFYNGKKYSNHFIFHKILYYYVKV
jgi:hypothetical protein